MGNVIKSGYIGRIHSEPIAVDLSDHLAEAQAVVDEARSHHEPVRIEGPCGLGCEPPAHVRQPTVSDSDVSREAG